MLSLRWSDVQLFHNHIYAVLRLRDTKSQHQSGAREFVMVRSSLAFRLLVRAKAMAEQ